MRSSLVIAAACCIACVPRPTASVPRERAPVETGPAIAARATADSFFAATMAERWTDAARWLDLNRFARFESRRAREIDPRSRVAEFGDSSRSNVMAAPLVESAARWLESQDTRTHQRDEWRRRGCKTDYPPLLFAITGEHVVGTSVHDDSTVYVIHDQYPLGKPADSYGMANSPGTITVSRTAGGWRVVPDWGVGGGGSFTVPPCSVDTATTAYPGLSCSGGTAGEISDMLQIDFMSWGCAGPRLRGIVIWRGAPGWRKSPIPTALVANRARLDSLLGQRGSPWAGDFISVGSNEHFLYSAHFGGKPRRFFAVRAETNAPLDTIASFAVSESDSLAVFLIDRVDKVGGQPTVRAVMLPPIAGDPLDLDDPELARAIATSPELVSFLGEEAPGHHSPPTTTAPPCPTGDGTTHGGVSIDFVAGGCTHPGLVAMVMWRGWSTSSASSSVDSLMVRANRAKQRAEAISRAFGQRPFQSHNVGDTLYALGWSDAPDRFVAVRSTEEGLDTLAVIPHAGSDSVLVVMIDRGVSHPVITLTNIAPIGCVPAYGLDPRLAQQMKRQLDARSAPWASRAVCDQAIRSLLASPDAMRFLTSPAPRRP